MKYLYLQKGFCKNPESSDKFRKYETKDCSIILCMFFYLLHLF